MRFMDAEFERLDKDKSGELDVKELTQSKSQVTHYRCLDDQSNLTEDQPGAVASRFRPGIAVRTSHKTERAPRRHPVVGSCGGAASNCFCLNRLGLPIYGVPKFFLGRHS